MPVALDHRRLRRARPGSRPALATRGWTVVTDGRDADALAGRDRRPAVLTASPATSRDADHRAAARRRVDRARPARPAGAQREHARPAPLRPLADLRPTELAEVLGGQRGGPLALTQRAAAAAAGARRRAGRASPRDAAVEHYETWGAYGARKAALDHLDPHPRPRRTGLRGVRRRPRRHAHRDAPGGLPGRGHLRPAAAGDRGPAPARADRRSGRPAAATGRPTSPAEVGRVTCGPRASARRPVFPAPDGATAPAPAEARGLARDEVRLLVAPTRAASTHARFRDLPRPAAAGRPAWWSTTPPPLPASSTHARRRRGRSSCTLATPLDDGTWVVELRTAPDAARRRCSTPSRASAGRPAAGATHLVAPYPRHGLLADGRGQPALAGRRRPATCAELPAPARPADRLRLPRPPLPAAAYQTVFAAARQRGDAVAPAGRSPATWSPAGRRGHRGRADHPAHRGVLAGGRRGAAGRVVRGAGGDRAAGQRDPRPRRTGGRGRHHGDPRAGVRRRRDGTVVGGRRAGPTGWSRPADPPRGRRRADHRLARPGGLAPAAGRGGRRRRR